MTPRQLDALLTRHLAATAMNELMFAQVVSMVANTGFRSFEQPTTPRDFMPSAQRKARSVQAPKRKRMTKKRQAEIASAIRSLFPIPKKVTKCQIPSV